MRQIRVRLRDVCNYLLVSSDSHTSLIRCCPPTFCCGCCDNMIHHVAGILSKHIVICAP